MSRISNLVKAGYITKTGLVGSAVAEAWTATEMLQNQTITKTGLDPEVLEDIASPTLGKVATPVISQSDEESPVYHPVIITCETEGATIYWKGGKQTSYKQYSDPLTFDDIGQGTDIVINAVAILEDYEDSDVATGTATYGGFA